MLSSEKDTNQSLQKSEIDKENQSDCPEEQKIENIIQNNSCNLVDVSRSEKLSEKDQKEFENKLKNLDQKELNLRNFKIGKVSVNNLDLLIKHLNENENLEVLNLSLNGLGKGNEENIARISEAIKNTKHLETLNLNGNGLERDVNLGEFLQKH